MSIWPLLQTLGFSLIHRHFLVLPLETDCCSHSSTIHSSSTAVPESDPRIQMLTLQNPFPSFSCSIKKSISFYIHSVKIIIWSNIFIFILAHAHMHLLIMMKAFLRVVELSEPSAVFNIITSALCWSVYSSMGQVPSVMTIHLHTSPEPS